MKRKTESGKERKKRKKDFDDTALFNLQSPIELILDTVCN